MLDLEEQLRRYADHVESQVGEVPTTASPPTLGRHRGWLLAATAAGIVAIVGVVVAITGGQDSRTNVREGPPTAPTTTAPSTAFTPVSPDDDTLDPGPLSPRTWPLIVPTHTALIVYGGEEALDDGAVYDRATGTWERMATGPLDRSPGRPVGVRVGELAAIAQGSTLAFYDPASDEWSEPIEIPPGVDALTYDTPSRVMIGWARDGFTVFTMAGADGLSVEIVEQQTVAGLSGAERIWTGTEVLEVSTAFPGSEAYRIRSWKPADGWRDVAEFTDSDDGLFGSLLGLGWFENELWVVIEDNAVVSFDPTTEALTRRPRLPVDSYEAVPRVHAVDDWLVVEFNPTAAVWTGVGWEVHPIDERALFGTVGPGADGQPAWWNFGTTIGDSTTNGFRATPTAGRR